MHLLNARDNEHVTVHDMRGFLVEDLIGAFKETEAISLGTKCTQYLFSLSLNPPPNADVPVAVFEAAIERIEAELGLAGQARAIVFHEKQGRRHAHCVWSRIDPESMTAINLPHYKNRLSRIAMELYQEHGWDMPEGFQDKAKRDPLAFDQVEAAQAKTIRRDPKELKKVFKDCWEKSDSSGAFRAALLSEGFVLARGSRRAFVAVDEHGKVYSLSRWTGAGAKALRERLGASEGLPSIEEAQAQFLHQEELPAQAIDLDLNALVERHRNERALLETKLAQAVQNGQRDRQAQLPKGLKGAWARLTGEYARIAELLANDAEKEAATHRAELDALIAHQMIERRAYQKAQEQKRALVELAKEPTSRTPDRRQRLVLPDDDPLPSAHDVDVQPDLVLAYLSDKNESFTLKQIDETLRSLSKDHLWRDDIRSRVLRSLELFSLSSDQEPRFTTRSYIRSQKHLMTNAEVLANDDSFAVDPAMLTQAIAKKNKALARVNASLSDEQKIALDHMLSDRALACVVGTAGSGKSTLLDGARTAWESAGIKVYGAALAGNAADGLEHATYGNRTCFS